MEVTMKEIYLDNSASTKIDSNVLSYLYSIYETCYGNPSSVHKIGQKSRKIIDESRELISSFLNIKNRELIFTSSGSESNNLALRGIMKSSKYKGNHIISTKIEHSSVLKTLEDLEKEGFEYTLLDVNNEGLISLEDLKNAIKPTTRLISIIHANNEIGTIQDIKSIGQICKEKNIIFHIDAVQSFGKIKFYPEDYHINLMSIASHKIYGPKGVGALYISTGTKIEKILTGGFQERNRRAGTEDVPNIAGFAKAVEIAYNSIYFEEKKEKELRDYMENEILKKISGVKINGFLENRLYNISNLTIENISSESLLFNLDLKNICISAGSACSSGTLNPSHVLLALGYNNKEAKSSIRISLGKYNTREEIDIFIKELELAVMQERNLSDLY
ncbi:MAG: cysteine desulfurase [Fusobacteriaceae bacterium]|nr:cysteine desulfurase [Fusobacteriaceae bacterium]